MRILLTGATGYLGSKLLDYFEHQGWKVGLLLRNKAKYVDQFSTKKVFWLEENGVVESSKESWDIAIHTATNYGKDHNSVSSFLQPNLLLPLTLLEALAQNKTCEYFFNIDTALPKGTNAYALSKKQVLDWIPFVQKEVKCVNIQLEYFYGPNDGGWKFLTMLTRKMLSGESEIPLTEGLQERDFIHIDDLISGFDILINSRNLFKESISSVEIGSGSVVSLRSLAIRIAEEIGFPIDRLKFGAFPARTNDVAHSLADISVMKELGWSPKLSIEEGIRQLVKEEKELQKEC